MGEPLGECVYAAALDDAADRYGLHHASIACHGCIDAPELIASGGVSAEWWPWSPWGGDEGGYLTINTVPRGIF